MGVQFIEGIKKENKKKQTVESTWRKDIQNWVPVIRSMGFHDFHQKIYAVGDMYCSQYFVMSIDTGGLGKKNWK